MLKRFWDSEPVVGIALVLLLVMLVQKVWLGEVITEEWVEWVLGLFGLATGASVLRNQVYSPKTAEGRRMKDHGEA